MPDREKVIAGLTMLADTKNDDTCEGLKCCKIAEDALELLKEQESVVPRYNARTNWYECGACHYSMTSGMHCRGELIPAYKVGFCAKCGQAVKWE